MLTKEKPKGNKDILAIHLGLKYVRFRIPGIRGLSTRRVVLGIAEIYSESNGFLAYWPN